MNPIAKVKEFFTQTKSSWANLSVHQRTSFLATVFVLLLVPAAYLLAASPIKLRNQASERPATFPGSSDGASCGNQNQACCKTSLGDMCKSTALSCQNDKCLPTPKGKDGQCPTGTELVNAGFGDMCVRKTPGNSGGTPDSTPNKDCGGAHEKCCAAGTFDGRKCKDKNFSCWDGIKCRLTTAKPTSTPIPKPKYAQARYDSRTKYYSKSPYLPPCGKSRQKCCEGPYGRYCKENSLKCNKGQCEPKGNK